MLRRFRRAGAVALLVLAATPPLRAGWSEGTPLPSLSAYGLEGTLPAVTTGKVVVVDFCASWCGPCKASFPVLDGLQKSQGSRGLVIVAVSVDDDPAALQKFLRATPVSFAVVRDAGQRLVKEADVSAMPTSFVVDAAGRIRYVHRGFHGKRSAEELARQVELLLKEKEARP